MAENKKAFVLYTDIIHTINQLPDDKAGLLFKHILSYVNDENPVSDDLIVNISFEPIKQQLKRDLDKYKATCERNKLNGKKGGRPKNTNPQITEQNPNNPVGLSGNPINPKKPDTDTDTDTDNGERERKRKNKKFTPPSPSEVESYALEKGYKIDGRKVCDYYTTDDPTKWIDGKGKIVASWKRKVLSVWCKEECKIKGEPTDEEMLYSYSVEGAGIAKVRVNKQTYERDNKLFGAQGLKLVRVQTHRPR
jgi:hypothetical protein